MNVYHALTFLSDLKGPKRDENRPTTICVLDNIIWGSNCLSWTGRKTRTGFVEVSILDPSPGQCASPFRFAWECVLDKVQHPCLVSSTVLTSCNPLWLLFISKSQIGATEDSIWENSSTALKRRKFRWSGVDYIADDKVSNAVSDE